MKVVVVKVVFACSIASLAACASVSYEPVTLDSSAPLDMSSVKKCPETLNVKDDCTALIQANQWMTRTGIKVKKGEKYAVRVHASQVWFDLDRRNTPPYGEAGSWKMRLFKKRHADAGFFALIINAKAAGSDQLLGHGDLGATPNLAYKTPDAGELVLYPNDALGPFDNPAYWYQNNSGQIWVTITRLEDSVTATSVSPPAR